MEMMLKIVNPTHAFPAHLDNHVSTLQVGAAALALALSLSACGGSTPANEAAANEATANDIVLTDEVPADLTSNTIDNGADALGNGADNALTVTGPGSSVTNTSLLVIGNTNSIGNRIEKFLD